MLVYFTIQVCSFHKVKAFPQEPPEASVNICEKTLLSFRNLFGNFPQKMFLSPLLSTSLMPSILQSCYPGTRNVWEILRMLMMSASLSV